MVPATALPLARRAPHRAALAALGLVLALPATTLGETGYQTSNEAYLTLTPAYASGQLVPLISSGEQLGDFTFEGIPDGIGMVPRGDGEVDLYVAHEQSHVPFGGFADFQDSSVSRLRVDVASRSILEAEVALPAGAGYIRFCSAFMTGPDQGFSDYTFWLNEESNDIIPVPAGARYDADPALAPLRQAGYAVSLDTASGAITSHARMGRFNHENTVFVPGGWNRFASLSGDDTFTAPGSQLYLYTAANERQVTNDKGQLWAFQVTRANGVAVDPYDPQNDANDYLEIDLGDDFAGRFIHVPSDVARGTTDVAPQTALEDWSNANNVFQFVRVEDLAYDPDQPRTVYFTDTGTTRLAEDPATGRLVRLASGGADTNGRVFKMVLSARDPRIVDSFSVALDASSIGMRNPDNLAVGHDSMLVQEDTSSAKVWRWDLASTWSQVATVTYPNDDVAANDAAGESSGVLDVSDEFGAGWWALDVQSHVNVATAPGPDGPDAGTEPDYTLRREDGQLLLMYLPGT